jgi:hypothetical protein
MSVTIQEYCTIDDPYQRLVRIQNILTALENAMVSGDMDFSREGYTFDDGQTKISTNFRSLTDITKAHGYYMRIADLLERRCNGGRIYTAREMKLR